LACKATFAEEIALVQNPDGGFLPNLRHNGKFYLSLLNIKNRIGRVTLSKYRRLFEKGHDLSAVVDGRKEGLGIEFDKFLGRFYERHNSSLMICECAEDLLCFEE
jgi:hypothetical protein